jgi:DNA-binding MarR family transcriptional regulator
MSRDSRRKTIEDAFGAAIRAYQTAVDNFDQAIADYVGVNRTDARCIDLLEQAGGMTAGELARAAGLTSGAVTAVVDRLEAAGFARRVPDAADRRRVRIEVTDKVWEANAPLMGPFLDDSQEILDDLTDAELERFTEFLQRTRELQQRHTGRIRTL